MKHVVRSTLDPPPLPRAPASARLCGAKENGVWAAARFPPLAPPPASRSTRARFSAEDPPPFASPLPVPVPSSAMGSSWLPPPTRSVSSRAAEPSSSSLRLRKNVSMVFGARMARRTHLGSTGVGASTRTLAPPMPSAPPGDGGRTPSFRLVPSSFATAAASRAFSRAAAVSAVSAASAFS